MKVASQVAKLFSNTFRYIDDLHSITPHLNRKLATHTHKQLELKGTTETDSRLSYLDLEINDKDRKFTTAVFDKQDGFSFHIVNFSHIDILTYLANQPMGFTYLNYS